MKVQSIISFFALYLISGLNAQVQEDQSYYQGFESSNLSPAIPSVSTGTSNSQPTQVQQPSSEDTKRKVTQESASKQQQQPSQQQNKPIEKPIGKEQVNGKYQTETQPTTGSQKPGTDPKQQTQPTSSSKAQSTQNPNGQSQNGKNRPVKDSGSTGSTGSCRKIRAIPKMNIVKVLQLVNKARGSAPPLKLDSALVKASVLKASSKSNKKKTTSSAQTVKAPLSPSKECGYKGKSAIQYTTIAKNEDDLIKKLMASKTNLERLNNRKYKAFGAAKVGTKWTLTFGEE